MVKELPVVLRTITNIRLQNENTSSGAQDATGLKQRGQYRLPRYVLKEVANKYNIYRSVTDNLKTVRSRDVSFNAGSCAGDDIWVQIDGYPSRRCYVINEFAVPGS